VLNKAYSFIYHEFIYNGHLQSASAASIVITASYVLTGKINFILAFVVYLLFLSIHMFDRLIDVYKDWETNTVRVKHILNNKKTILIIFVSSVVILITTSIALLSSITSIYIVLILFVGFLYPIIFKDLTKHIFMFKNIFVSSFYVILLIITASISNESSISNGIVLFLYLFIFAEVLISQVILDTKDIATDRKAGLLTFPVVFGLERTFKLITIFSAVILLFLLLCIALFNYPYPFYIIVVVMFFLDQASLKLTKEKNLKGLILAAAKFIALPLLVLIS
jgi:4-hydroxybenzoate polyprenyltransferase